jgi:hypothetical protein
MRSMLRVSRPGGGCTICHLVREHHTVKLEQDVQAGTWMITLYHGSLWGYNPRGGGSPGQMTSRRFGRCADAFDVAWLTMRAAGGRHKLHVEGDALGQNFHTSRPDDYQMVALEYIDPTPENPIGNMTARALTSEELRRVQGFTPDDELPADTAAANLPAGPPMEELPGNPPPPRFTSAPPSSPPVAGCPASLYGMEVRVSAHIPDDHVVFTNRAGMMVNAATVRDHTLTQTAIAEAVAMMHMQDRPAPVAVFVSPLTASLLARNWPASAPLPQGHPRYTDSPGSDDPLENLDA